MVSLTKKTVNGCTYWYAVKSARVNGHPRIVWQKYLGSADAVLKCITQDDRKNTVRLKSMPLGHVAALARANDDLHFVEIVDRHTIKKDTGGLSVGQYILLQIMGRADGALSRDAIAEWYPKSVASMLMDTPHKMNAKNLLKHLDYPTKDAIREIEEEVDQQLILQGLSPSMLLWDTSNFFTQIEHGENIPKKGHSKEHRNDKNLIGVGLAVSAENVPFFHETYEANMHDSKIFSDIIDVIVERLLKLKVDASKVVMVMDKGNNSDENVATVLKKTHIIGSLRADQAKEYLEVPLDKYELLDPKDAKNEDAITTYRTKGNHYGEDLTIVITRNPKTERKQKSKYEETRAEVLKELADHKKRVEKRDRRGRPWTLTSATRGIVKIIPEHIHSVFEYEVKKKVGRGGGLIMTYSINKEKERLRYKAFGKLVHFTDLHDWSSKEIYGGYNAKYQIEDDFKWLKNKLLVPIKPVHVWTDQHIRAHVFICVMGLLFYRYIQWKLRKRKLDLTTEELDTILNGIRLAIVKKGNKNQGKFVVEEMDRDQVRVFTILEMDEYIKA